MIQGLINIIIQIFVTIVASLLVSLLGKEVPHPTKNHAKHGVEECIMKGFDEGGG